MSRYWVISSLKDDICDYNDFIWITGRLGIGLSTNRKKYFNFKF